MQARLKNRRGAVMVMASVMMVSVVLIMAFGIDLSKAYVQANQLQTAADAAAHAGAVQLFLVDTTHIASKAVEFGQANKVLGHSAIFTAADVKCGTWDPATLTFTETTCGAAANAVKATGKDPRQYMFNRFWNLTGRQTSRSAVAWVSPNVISGECIKPFSVPYPTLTKTINPGRTDTLRALDSDDERRLATMTAAQLTFTLKTDEHNKIGPGNFSIVQIDGPDDYEATIKGCSKRFIGPDTLLETLTGGRIGPTLHGLGDLCASITNSGDCLNSAGQVGSIIKVPLWTEIGSLQGKSAIKVKIVASFSLDYAPQKGKDQGTVKGHWVRVSEPSAIGTTKGTMQRIVLVQ